MSTYRIEPCGGHFIVRDCDDTGRAYHPTKGDPAFRSLAAARRWAENAIKVDATFGRKATLWREVCIWPNKAFTQ